MDEPISALDKIDSRGRSDVFYRKVRQLTGQNMIRKGSKAIKNMDGRLLTDKSDVKEKWKELIETFYNAGRKPGRDILGLEHEDEVNKECKGSDMLVSEIRAAIKELKGRRAVGIDEIPAEFWKSFSKEAIEELMKLSERIYKEGIWPEDFTKAVLMPLPKKMNALAREDHRTISLIPRASKIMLRILTKGLEGKVRHFISKAQFGFKKACGTREAIGVMRMLRWKAVPDHSMACFYGKRYSKSFEKTCLFVLLTTQRHLTG